MAVARGKFLAFDLYYMVMARRESTTIDTLLIHLGKRYGVRLAQVALFVVFFWFGAIKLFGVSPANPLVGSLLVQTLPWWPFDSFIVVFGLYEMMIGAAFLWPRLWRLAIFLLVLHMGMTALPLFFLPSITWQAFLIPTLEGQYIIKNLVIIALAFTLTTHLHPLHKHVKHKRHRARK